MAEVRDTHLSSAEIALEDIKAVLTRDQYGAVKQSIAHYLANAEAEGERRAKRELRRRYDGALYNWRMAAVEEWLEEAP